MSATGEPAAGGRAHRQGVASLRAGRRARHCLPVRWAIGRRCDRPPVVDERHGSAAVEAVVFLWSRAAGGGAEGVGWKGRKLRRRPARLQPSRQNEWGGGSRQMVASHGKGGVIDAALNIPS